MDLRAGSSWRPALSMSESSSVKRMTSELLSLMRPSAGSVSLGVVVSLEREGVGIFFSVLLGLTDVLLDSVTLTG